MSPQVIAADLTGETAETTGPPTQDWVTVGGRNAYPMSRTKAAALLQSIVSNYALIDLNKRLGWLATAVFLQLNGVDVNAAAHDALQRRHRRRRAHNERRRPRGPPRTTPARSVRVTRPRSRTTSVLDRRLEELHASPAVP